MHLAQIRDRLRQAGAAPIHAQRVLRLWLHGAALVGAPSLDHFLPHQVRQALPELEAELAALLHLRSVHPSEDGSERLLLGLGDGQAIESVLLPREGLCVSTQVGCAVGCVFCMTGRSGLIRHVGSAEIVAQVVLARQRRPVTKVVFMGMGEPAHNLDAVLDAIDLLGTAGGIAHKKLVFSTVGDPRAFARLPLGPVKPALALSLHSSDAALREQLLPRAPRIAPDELVALGDDYARRTGYPIQYQWTLLDGVNDSAAERDGIVRLLKGRYAVLNLIPYNTVDDLPFKRPGWDQAVAMAKELHRRGVLTKLRQSAGQDIDGGCGQLRARAARMRKTVIRSDGVAGPA
ncbi:MAG: rRNA methyltransferase [Xanthomonadaceae bacterium]|nr:rRNA methyltransferase [Xanthomonadaceae bacterium]